MDVRPLVSLHTTKLDYMDPRGWSGGEPLFDQIMQGFLGGVHDPLLRPRPSVTLSVTQVRRQEYGAKGSLQSRANKRFMIVNVFNNNDRPNVMYIGSSNSGTASRSGHACLSDARRWSSRTQSERSQPRRENQVSTLSKHERPFGDNHSITAETVNSAAADLGWFSAGHIHAHGAGEYCCGAEALVRDAGCLVSSG